MMQAETNPDPSKCVECGSDYVVNNTCRNCGVVQPGPQFGEEVYAGPHIWNNGREREEYARYAAPNCGHSTKPVSLWDMPRNAGVKIHNRIHACMRNILHALGGDIDLLVKSRVVSDAELLFRQCCADHAPRNHVVLGVACLYVSLRKRNLRIPLKGLLNAALGRKHNVTFRLLQRVILDYPLLKVLPTTSETWMGGILENTITQVQTARSLNGQAKSFATAMRACTNWVAQAIRGKVRGQPINLAAGTVYAAGWYVTIPHIVTQRQVAGAAGINACSVRDMTRQIYPILSGRSPPVPPIHLG